MNSTGVALLCIVIFIVLVAPRRWALMGMMIGVLYITQGHAVDVFGLSMYAHRFMEVAGLVRVVLWREFSFTKTNQIDRAFIGLYIYTTLAFFLRSRHDPYMAYQIGVAVDSILCYVIFRGLTGDAEDLQWFLKHFVILLIPYTVLLFVESFTQVNPFAGMGGVELANWLREGRLRCQGSFRQPSILGSLGATFLPLYIGLMFARASRVWATTGVVLCLLIVYISNSGGPLNTAAIAVVGWLMWPMRANMRTFRRFLAVGIIGMALCMKAPIWYLPAKASALTGGDGWHRSYLIDIAYRNLGQWWFSGMAMEDTRDWFPSKIEVTGAADITNEYLSFGLSAGLVAMFLFGRLLVLLFKNLGRARALDRSVSSGNDWNQYALWSLGVMLTGHLFNLLGITYFDQFHFIWFMQLAFIVTLTESILEAPGEEDEEVEGSMEDRRPSDEEEPSMTFSPVREGLY